MTFKQSVNTCFKKYFTFSGRASRSEYWNFWLFWLLVNIALLVVNSILFGPTLQVAEQIVIAQDGSQSTEVSKKLSYNSGIFGNVFNLAVLIPGVAVAYRRLHDTGRKGWWMLFPFAVLLAVVPAIFLLTLGWDHTVEALQATDSVKIQVGPVGSIGVIAVFGSCIALLFWLTRPSQPSSNKYGPNPQEVTP